MYDFANEFDILPQSSSPNDNNNKGGERGHGGADVSSPLKGMVVEGNRSSQAHQYHRRGGNESGFSPPSSSMIDHDAGGRHRPLTGLARDGSPATVFGGKMGTSPPMSARRNANNLSSLSKGMTNNTNSGGRGDDRRVRPPLFATNTVTASTNDALTKENDAIIGAKQQVQQKDPYDEKEANEARDASTKLLVQIAEYLESTKTEEERELEEKRKEAASGRKRKTPVKKSGAAVKKEEEENDVVGNNAMMMSTPPPSLSRKGSNAAATTTPNVNATPQQIKGGLKSFAMKVCEKVKERGTTTYDEVSDALVADVLAEREKEGIPLSIGGGSNRKKVNKKKEDEDEEEEEEEEGNEDEAMTEGDGLSSPIRRNKVEVKVKVKDDDDTKEATIEDDGKKKKANKTPPSKSGTTTPRGTKEKKKSKRANETVDEKNIRRRVYDALNVLIAINVVSRDKNGEKKKTITWNGIGEEFGEAFLYGDLAAPPRDKNEKQDDAKREKDVIMKKKKEEEEEEEQQQQQMIMKKEELTVEEQEENETENRETRERIRKKALYLAELTEQFDALLSLVQRNERNEIEAQKKVATPKKESSTMAEGATTKKGGASASAKKKSAKKDNVETTTTVAEDDDVPSVPDGIQLPFILVQTDQKATVEVEISEDQRVVHFDFNESPFQVYDGNYVLKHTEGIQTEMAKMKKERMQRLGVKKYDESIFQSPEEEREEEEEEAPQATTPKKAKRTKKSPP